jgi:hypothetical protein
VGKGVKGLPFATEVMGRTREDVIWENVGAEEKVGLFWIKVILVGLAVAMTCELSTTRKCSSS